MMTIRDPRGQPVVTSTISDISSAALSLAECSQNGSSASAERIVSVTKKFGLLAESWLLSTSAAADPISTEISSPEDLSQKIAIYTVPSIILKFLASSSVVHDTFQSAFQLSVDVCCKLHELQKETDTAFSQELSTVFNDCLGWIGRIPLNTMIDLRRVEALVVFLSAFFENYFSVKRCEESVSSPIDALICIMELVQRMKGAMIDMKTNSINAKNSGEEGLTAEEEKEIRTCYSDIRGSCIATANSIILACPSWVTADTDRFWRLCTQSLSTPLLLSAGYRASSLSTLDQDFRSSLLTSDAHHAHQTSDVNDLIYEAHEILTGKIVGHVQSALKNVCKYSPIAMDDVIIAIRELCDAKCVELLPAIKRKDTTSSIKDSTTKVSTEITGESATESDITSTTSISTTQENSDTDFLSELLRAYESHPKAPTGRAVDKTIWKVSAAAGLTEIFRLSPRASYNPHYSPQSSSPKTLAENIENSVEIQEGGEGGDNSKFKRGPHSYNSNPSVLSFSNLFIEIICEDLMVLYRTMGTISDPTETSKESKARGKNHFGTLKTESLSNMLLTLTACLVAFLESNLFILKGKYSGEEGVEEGENEGAQEGDEVAYQTLSNLAEQLHSIIRRKVIFEDDAVQVCCESDLLSKIAIHFWFRSQSHQENNHKSSSIPLFDSNCILSAVEALCATGFETGETAGPWGPGGLGWGGQVPEPVLRDMLSPFYSTVYGACRDALLLLGDEAYTSHSSYTSIVVTDRKDVNQQLNYSEKYNYLTTSPSTHKTSNTAPLISLQALLPTVISDYAGFSSLTLRKKRSHAVQEILKKIVIN